MESRVGSLYNRHPDPFFYDSRVTVDNVPTSANRHVWGLSTPGQQFDRINRKRIMEAAYLRTPITHENHPAHSGEYNYPVDPRTVVFGTPLRALGWYGLGNDQ